MRDLFSKCGANCGRCPSYNENLLTDEARRRCSAGWHKYHGFRLSPEKILCCDSLWSKTLLNHKGAARL